LHHHKVTGVISVASVGGIRGDLHPGDIVLPNQILDYTWGRNSTFFDGNGTPVHHVDFTEPYDADLSRRILAAGQELGIEIKVDAVCATQGRAWKRRPRSIAWSAMGRCGRHDRHAGSCAGA
jgi:5'-methylthioadenosine phosphorylase